MRKKETFLRVFLQKWHVDQTRGFRSITRFRDFLAHASRVLRPRRKKIEPRRAKFSTCRAKWALLITISETSNVKPFRRFSFHRLSVWGLKHWRQKAGNLPTCHAKSIVLDPLHPWAKCCETSIWPTAPQRISKRVRMDRSVFKLDNRCLISSQVRIFLGRGLFQNVSNIFFCRTRRVSSQPIP